MVLNTISMWVVSRTKEDCSRWSRQVSKGAGSRMGLEEQLRARQGGLPRSWRGLGVSFLDWWPVSERPMTSKWIENLLSSSLKCLLGVSNGIRTTAGHLEALLKHLNLMEA